MPALWELGKLLREQGQNSILDDATLTNPELVRPVILTLVQSLKFDPVGRGTSLSSYLCVSVDFAECETY